ncbi:hypothetical protein QZH45_25260 [Pseudomonas corrugata]|uniref:hypothetical protein n=1 Tax=Pseudomonas corrugata TaxID=47879 RepID=UPI0006D8AB73|nr:hypothetical protein [Pseudomonas corrugata]AOE62194.1 hypothetical protein AXG94_10605 [Pseudomonas corrugata]
MANPLLSRFSLGLLLTCLTITLSPCASSTEEQYKLTLQGNGYESARTSFPGLQFKWDRHESLLEQMSLDMEVELQWAGLDRYDAADLRELSLSYRPGPWQLGVGLSRVFWGVTESRHLVDVVNQVDLRFDPDGDARLSQPMASVGYRGLGRNVTLYALPCYRERPDALIFGEHGAQDPAYEQAIFTPLRCSGQTDFAVRATQVAGPADIGLSYFRGHSREPYAGHSPASSDPTYPEVNRFAVDTQVTLGAWLLKLEALLQDSEHGIDRASVSGFEYTWVSAFNGASDLSLLYEHLTDTRCDSVIASCGEMLGIRWIANDVADTNLLVSSVRDRQNGLWGLKVQGSRRIDEQLSLLLNSGGMYRARYLSVGLSYAF